MIQKTVFVRNYSIFFYYFTNYHIKILLGDFNSKVGRQNIFKLTIENENLHLDSKDNGVRIVNFATSKIWFFATSNIWLIRVRCSRTETFIITPGPFLMERLPTILITY